MQENTVLTICRMSSSFGTTSNFRDESLKTCKIAATFYAHLLTAEDYNTHCNLQLKCIIT